MLKKRAILSILICALSIGVKAQEQMTPEQYIAKYKDFALIEMHRASVPASITLAQGMLESSYGNSRLAKEAMNHFGIKCKSDWKGGVIYADDDAPNECFRAYKSVLESYRDHSEFLRNNWRYQSLFSLKITDYKGWAEGLRKAGYATNPKYHSILINLIERHELYKYDLMPRPELQTEVFVSANNIPAIYAGKDATAESIASEHDLRAKHIYKYNDMQKGAELHEGEIIYLKPKRRKGSADHHTVSDGESMHMISQMYGIKLKHLYKKNRLEPGTEPKVGEKLELQHKRPKSDTIDVKDEQELARLEILKKEFVNPHATDTSKAEPVVLEEQPRPEYYIVQKGDNIYRISERFQVLEEDLLLWNKLNSMTLQVGQKLYLSAEAAKKNIKSTTPNVERDDESETMIIKEDPKPAQPSPGAKYHVVQSGETVYRICVTYGITQAQLMKWNNMESATIYAGQKLRVSE